MTRSLNELDGIPVWQWTEEDAHFHLQATFNAACRAFPDLMERYVVVLGDAFERRAEMQVMQTALRETVSLAERDRSEGHSGMSEWRTIESAPRDGTRILAFGELGLEADRGVGTVAWCSTYSVWQCSPNEASEYDPEPCKITHWMPLPEPP